MNDQCDEDFAPEPWTGETAVTPEQLTILVVDDDEMMRRLVRRALVQFGFSKIYVAENGADALAAAEREVPNIIISDYNMPEMHGLELVEAIRSNTALDRTAVIMLSAADEQDVIECARDLGADTFMIKPFETNALKELIGTLYQRFNCGHIVWPN